jgi:glutamate 5-kinase
MKAIGAKRWVVKIGSALLTNSGSGLDNEGMKRWTTEIARLQRQGIEVVLVSSGAIAEGVSHLGLKQRPVELPKLQAAAAVGQMRLMQAYETSFNAHGVRSAQILLTHEDFANRRRYLNISSTLRTLLRLQVVPVINENDTVSTEEIRFGDNDILAALVANMIGAERLVILTDQNGLYTSNPRTSPDAELIPAVSVDDDRLIAIAGGSSTWGRRGMASKVKAAKLFALSGGMTTIASGYADNLFEKIRLNESVGTIFLPGRKRLLRRKQWLAGHLRIRGAMVLDADAISAIEKVGGDVLVAGVKAIRGHFGPGEMIQIQDMGGGNVGKGISNYSAVDISRMLAGMRLKEHLSPASGTVKALMDHKNILLD